MPRRLVSKVETGEMFGLFNKHKLISEAPSKNGSEPSEHPTWQSIFSKADAGHDESIAAVTALNVRVICELAPFVRDRARYESYQHEAIDLALSIRHEPYRSLAMKEVEAFPLLAGNTEPAQHGTKRDSSSPPAQPGQQFRMHNKRSAQGSPGASGQAPGHKKY
jgi:hypothetical protein